MSDYLPPGYGGGYAPSSGSSSSSSGSSSPVYTVNIPSNVGSGATNTVSYPSVIGGGTIAANGTMTNFGTTTSTPTGSSYIAPTSANQGLTQAQVQAMLDNMQKQYNTQFQDYTTSQQQQLQQQQLQQQQLQQQQQAWQSQQQTSWQDILNGMNEQTSTSKQYTESMLANFQNVINQMNGEREADRTAADEAAKRIADEKKKSINSMVTSLTGNQQSDLQSINNNLASAKQSVEDQTFQNWLATRQSVVNNGVQNSGLADDANTRLMMSNNRSLADLYAKNQTAISDVNRTYGDKMYQAEQSLSDVNESQIAQDEYRKLFESGNQTLIEQAKLYSGLVGATLPYSQAKPGELLGGSLDLLGLNQKDKQASNELQFKYDQLNTQDKQFYDGLDQSSKQFYAGLNQTEQHFYSSLEQADRQFYAGLEKQDRQFYTNLGTLNQQFYDTLDNTNRKAFIDMQFKYDELSSKEQQFFTKLDQDQQHFVAKLSTDYDISMTKLMGVDPQGNMTLDAHALTETIRSNLSKESEANRHNMVSEAVGKTNAATDQARLQETIRNNTDRLKVDHAQLQNSQWKEQSSQLYQITRTQQDRMDTIIKLQGADGYKDLSKEDKARLDTEFKEAAQRYDASVILMSRLADGGNPVQGSLPQTMTDPVSASQAQAVQAQIDQEIVSKSVANVQIDSSNFDTVMGQVFGR